jgi:hypothetical protein
MRCLEALGLRCSYLHKLNQQDPHGGYNLAMLALQSKRDAWQCVFEGYDLSHLVQDQRYLFYNRIRFSMWSQTKKLLSPL